MKFIELFAGIGGFRAGLEPLAHECVGWVEWDKYARKSYTAIWPEAEGEWNGTDITAVADDDLRELDRRVGGIDLLCFGSPCQDVSVAGRRSGFVKDGELTRSGLFFEAMRFARILRPKYLLMENVVGMLSSNEGRDFATVIACFHEVGMEFVEWQVCDATDFGIPQNRERVFVVGHLGGIGGRKVFPIFNTDGETAAEPKCVGMLDIKGQDVIRRVYAPTLTTMAGGNREPKIIDDQGRRNKRLEPLDICPTLRSQSHGNEPKILDAKMGGNVRVYDTVSPTLQANGYKEPLKVVSAVLTPDREEKRQNGRRIKEPDEPMFTLTAQDKHGVIMSSFPTPHEIGRTVRTSGRSSVDRHSWDVVQIPVVKNHGEWSERDTAQCVDANYYKGIDNHGARTEIATNARIRKLTPRECWRLMGRTDEDFDKAKAAGISDSQLYKQAGNSLVPQIVTEIGKRLTP